MQNKYVGVCFQLQHPNRFPRNLNHAILPGTKNDKIMESSNLEASIRKLDERRIAARS
jgi:hypothetical protein